MLLPNQIQELLDIVDSFHVLFIAETGGSELLSNRDRKLLKSFGVDITEFAGKDNYLNHAFQFGMLASALRNKGKIKDFSYEAFKKYLKSGGAFKLTDIEKYALQHVKQRAYTDIKGLGNRIGRDLTTTIINASQKRAERYRNIIRREVSRGILDRKSLSEISSALGEKTKDWTRDFDRIADYVMHEAYQTGISKQLLDQYGEDVKVWFDVKPDACEHCVRTYLKDGPGSEPRQFYLRDVIANGDNIGVKAKDYKPSVAPLHPWCRCTMHEVPENMIWNPVRRMFVPKRETYGVKRKSKVKVKVEYD